MSILGLNYLIVTNINYMSVTHYGMSLHFLCVVSHETQKDHRECCNLCCKNGLMGS
jgi:hypothetical protein